MVRHARRSAVPRRRAVPIRPRRGAQVASAAVGVAVGLASAGLAAAETPSAGPIALTVQQRAQFKPLSGLLAHPPLNEADLERQSAARRTIPFWREKVTSPADGKTYAIDMVGRSPYGAPSRTSIPYQIIFARVHLPDGTVLDPTRPAACDTVPVETRFVNSPLFNPTSFTSNGVDVSGPAGEQLVSAFQRANFWSQVNGSIYGVVLTAAAPPITLDITAPAGSSDFTYQQPCSGGGSALVHYGEIDVNALDALAQAAIAAQHVQPSALALFVTYDVVEPEGGNFYLFGYHNAVPVANGTQTYAVAAYLDPGFFFAPIHDIGGWSHELAEWADDPFVQQKVAGGGLYDRTPLWGHVGQAGGCQDNLEVGDPLTGTAYPIAGAGGFTYSFQDLAFHDWFYRTPASGAGGKYSFQGGFTTDAGAVCKG